MKAWGDAASSTHWERHLVTLSPCWLQQIPCSGPAAYTDRYLISRSHAYTCQAYSRVVKHLQGQLNNIQCRVKGLCWASDYAADSLTQICSLLLLYPP